MVDEGITHAEGQGRRRCASATSSSCASCARHSVPTVKLRVDANQGYRTWKEALRVTRIMPDENIWYMEQPCEGLENMARVAQNTDVPIMADESAWSARDVLRLIAVEGGRDGLGLLHQARRTDEDQEAARGRRSAAGCCCDINGSGEMGIGNAANLHLAASSPIIVPARHDPGVAPPREIVRTKVAGHKYLDDIINEPVRVPRRLHAGAGRSGTRHRRSTRRSCRSTPIHDAAARP